MTGALPLSGDVRGEYGGGFSPNNTGGWVELGNGGKPKKGENVIPVCVAGNTEENICQYFSFIATLMLEMFHSVHLEILVHETELNMKV